MRLISFVLAAALALSACGPRPALTPPPPSPRAEAVKAAAETTATILDAINLAPPTTLNRTTIDEAAIRTAFRTFRRALTIIEVAVDSGVLTRNSPTALRLKRAVLMTQASLNAASEAQRAGSATTYREALDHALAAITDAQLVLATK